MFRAAPWGSAVVCANLGSGHDTAHPVSTAGHAKPRTVGDEDRGWKQPGWGHRNKGQARGDEGIAAERRGRDDYHFLIKRNIKYGTYHSESQQIRVQIYSQNTIGQTPMKTDCIRS